MSPEGVHARVPGPDAAGVAPAEAAAAAERADGVVVAAAAAAAAHADAHESGFVEAWRVVTVR
jgi:hypothetical protein